MEFLENVFVFLICLWKFGFNVIIGYIVCSGGIYNKGIFFFVCLNFGYLLDFCFVDDY